MSSPNQSSAAPRYALLRPLGRARPGWGRDNAVYTPYPFPASARHVGLRPRTGQHGIYNILFSRCIRRGDRARFPLSLYKAALLECWNPRSRWDTNWRGILVKSARNRVSRDTLQGILSIMAATFLSYIGTFLSTPSFQIEKKYLFLRDFLPVDAKIVWFNLTP